MFQYMTVGGVTFRMFTGLARDFANFKKEFETVIVPNRHPTDVAMYLRAAVPTELETQLFDSLDFPDYMESCNNHLMSQTMENDNYYMKVNQSILEEAM